MPEIDLGLVVGPQGKQGETGPTGAQGIQGLQGIPGEAGKSAYRAAKDGGFTGTEAEFNSIMAVINAHAGRHKKGGADEIAPDMIGAIGAVGAYYGHNAAESLDDILDASFTIGLSSDRYTALRTKLGNSTWATGIQVFYSTKSTTASRIQLLVGNTGRCATRYYFSNNNAWGEWQAVATTDYALPRDGSQPMTGNLKFRKVDGNGYGQIHKNHSTAADYGMQIKDVWVDADGAEKSAVMQLRGSTGEFKVSFNGTSEFKDILHTGNKPSGSYTGNGDATERTIETGGIGNVCAIWSSGGTFIIFPGGGFGKNSVKGNFYFDYAEISFNNGKLTINSIDYVNQSGITYNYQVL